MPITRPFHPPGKTRSAAPRIFRSFRPFPSLLTQALAIALLSLSGFSTSQALTGKDVLVIYNSTDEESKNLALTYKSARSLPDSRLLGLELPNVRDISRKEYDDLIVAPLRDYMDEMGWWTRTRNQENLLMPTANRIQAIVLMRGVPLRILPGPKPATEPGKSTPGDPISPRDEASVDSELAMSGIETPPAKGILKNTFYSSEVNFSKANFPFMFLTARIDAPTYAICKRMITDAVETERTGLWGRAYVDIANKFPEGDEWMEQIVNQNLNRGIPTLVDRFNDTLPKNFPMMETAIYYGWYDWNVSGPFRNTRFLFRPGAIAVHLHSFSAQQLTDGNKNWCAPLLMRGATATVGNVYEPYLHLTHHFSIMHDRLLRGWSLAEAAWASMPVTSWQGVVLGDPLYRPFLRLDGTGQNRPEDRDFRAMRAAARQWPGKNSERLGKLAAAAEKLSSGSLAEGLAQEYREEKDLGAARTWFEKAKAFYPERRDKLRQDLQLIAMLREQKKKGEAIAALRVAKETYRSIPEVEAVAGWLDILDPPPPPIADPTEIPKQ